MHVESGNRNLPAIRSKENQKVNLFCRARNELQGEPKVLQHNLEIRS